MINQHTISKILIISNPICLNWNPSNFKIYDIGKQRTQETERNQRAQVKTKWHQHRLKTVSHPRHHFLHDKWQRRIIIVYGCTQKYHHTLSTTQKTHISLHYELCQSTSRPRHPWSQHLPQSNIHLIQDAVDKTNPFLRALAVRTMGCIRIKDITEYLCDPLKKALKD